MLGFYMLVAPLPSIYEVKLPMEVTQLLSRMTLVLIRIDGHPGGRVVKVRKARKLVYMRITKVR